MYNYSNTPQTEYAVISAKVSQEIQQESDEQIIGTKLSDLANFYYYRERLIPLEIDLSRSSTIKPVKEWGIIPAHQREGPFQYDGDLKFEFEYIWLYVPILPHPQFKRLSKLTGVEIFSAYRSYDVNWSVDIVSIKIPVKGYGYNHSDEKVVEDIDQAKQWFTQQVSKLAGDINTLNNEFKHNIESWIAGRKAIIEQHNSRYDKLLKKISIPLHKKEDAATTRIKLATKPIVQRIKPNPQKPEEYEIDRNKVIDIIEVLDNQGRQFEKTPKTYANSGEEDLRNVLLVNLNSIFEGKATGETFSNKGKTDIYLNIDKGNILVFECKFWEGLKKYHQTIEQLLGYLSWRMNYAVIIKFYKQKNFEKSLSDVKDIVEKHPSYRTGFQQINKTHFLSQHRLPTDDLKNVEIHHLFYKIS